MACIQWAPDLVEYHLTAAIAQVEGTEWPDAVEDLYGAVGQFLAANDAAVAQEHLYAPTQDPGTLSARRRAGLEESGLRSDWPWTLVGGRPWEAPLLGGVQIHAASRDAVRSSLLPAPARSAPEGDPPAAAGAGGSCGTSRLTLPGASLLYLASVTGMGADGRWPRGEEAQAAQMFDNAQALLGAAGADYARVIRTWIYLPRILDWYAQFNRARTLRYRQFGVFRSDDERVLPASTGIQGAGPAGADCHMDLLAVQPRSGGTPRVRRLCNPRQSEAPSYGSSFSRAVELSHAGLSRLFVSGTASINEQSRTMHADDMEAQVLHTLMNVGMLLQAAGAGWQDLCVATAFFKRAEDIPCFDRVRRTLGMARFPVVQVVADVCRPDLLFELEASAVYGSEG